MASDQTKLQILDTAEELLALEGYVATSHRRVADGAGVNLAAIRYHFGDKKALYRDVLQYAFFSLTGEDPAEWAGAEAGGPEQGIEALVRSLLSQLLREGESARFANLVAREMVDPTEFAVPRQDCRYRRSLRLGTRRRWSFRLLREPPHRSQ